MDDLVGKVAVVTGAASGIGFALCERLLRDGMHVVLVDLPGERLDAAAGTLSAQAADAGGVLAAAADVADETALEGVLAAAREAYGGVDLLCLNAGVLGPTNIPLWEITAADWRWVFGVNWWGVVNGLRAFVPHLLTRDSAHIAVTASVAGLVTGEGEAPYVTSKHALVALTEILRRQLAGTAVGVTLLCPWWVRTDILASTRNRGTADGEPLPVHRELLDQGISPDELADLAVRSIREGRFYVHTRPELISAALTERCAEILGR